MKIELHILQNFAPSNLNRDDTGAPKDCELGGYRRARISSQCQKRAVRGAFVAQGLLAPDEMGMRTKRIVHALVDELQQRHGLMPDVASRLAATAVEGVGLGRNKKGDEEDQWKTEYLLFVPRRIVKELAQVIVDHRQAIEAVAASEGAEGVADDKPKKKAKAKDAKKDAKAGFPKDARDALLALFEHARGTVDVALFGRMIADAAKWNVEASCQVAHAVSTNCVQMDFDFFTAVDDLKPRDTAGSDMMGTIQFNSSCFYRYAVLDTASLAENLDAGAAGNALAPKAAQAFVRAFIEAIPTGKQNTFAAHNPPSYVLAVARDKGQPVSLTNAFLKPARPRGEDIDLVDDSVTKLEGYFARLGELVGTDRKLAVAWADRDIAGAPAGISRASTVAELLDKVRQAVTGAT